MRNRYYFESLLQRCAVAGAKYTLVMLSSPWMVIKAGQFILEMDLVGQFILVILGIDLVGQFILGMHFDSLEAAKQPKAILVAHQKDFIVLYSIMELYRMDSIVLKELLRMGFMPLHLYFVVVIATNFASH